MDYISLYYFPRTEHYSRRERTKDRQRYFVEYSMFVQADLNWLGTLCSTFCASQLSARKTNTSNNSEQVKTSGHAGNWLFGSFSGRGHRCSTLAPDSQFWRDGTWCDEHQGESILAAAPFKPSHHHLLPSTAKRPRWPLKAWQPLFIFIIALW